MAQLPAPSVRLRIYSLPEGAEYVLDHTDADVVGGGVNGRYSQLGNRPLDFFFGTGIGQLSYDLLYETEYVTTFASTQRANAKSTWAATIMFPSTRRSEAQAVKSAIDPADNGSFAIWHISTADDDRLFVDRFLGGNLGDDLGVPNGPPAQQLYPLIPSTSELPGYVARGGGGPLLSAGLSAKANGDIELSIEGADWAQCLEETTHTQDHQLGVLVNGQIGLRQLITGILVENSTAPLSSISDIADRENFLGSQVVATALGTTSLAQLADSATVPTTVGQYTIIAAMRADAAATISTDIRWRSSAGRHSLLSEVTRLCERAGILFTMPLPIVYMFAPGNEDSPTQTWGPEDYFDADETSRRPNATGWVIHHSDYWRDWTYYTPDLEAVDEHGLILRHTTSPAYRPQSQDTDIVLDGCAPDTEASVEALHAELQAAAAVESIRAAETQTAKVDVRWGPGTRYGVDFQLGDTIRLTGGPSTRKGLVVREVSMALAADGRWNFQVGLGALVQLSPKLRGEYILNKNPQVLQSGTQA